MTPAVLGAVLVVSCGTCLLAGWLAYPVGLAAWARLRTRPQTARSVERSPSVTVVVATREDPAVVQRRVADLRSSDYLADKLSFIVALDARAPHDAEAYRSALSGLASVVTGDDPGGKASTLNAGVRAATGDLVLFADSHQSYASGAISELVRAFGDPTVGAVTGAYRLEEEPTRLLRWFWRYEMLLRRLESRVHSVVAVTGAIYAIRRELWVPLPAHAICDDLFVPARIVFSGHRVVSCESAHALDPRRFSRSHDVARKVRTLTGLIQFCLWEPRALSPRANPIWIQFVCHKLIRLGTPLLMMGAVVGVAVLGAGVLGQALRALVLVAAVAVVVFVLRPRLGRKALSELAWFGFLLGAPLRAIRNAMRGEWDVWRSQEPRLSDQPEPLGLDAP